LMNNPDYWEDPEVFNPDRFTMEKRKGRHHFLHIPFSAGHRQCIGTNFSLIEQKLFLVRLLQKYKVVDPKNNKPLGMDQFISYRHRVCVYLEKR